MLAAAVVMAVLLGPPAAGEEERALPPPECVRTLRAARIAQEQGRESEAVKLLERAVGVCPDPMEPYVVALGFGGARMAEAVQRLEVAAMAEDGGTPTLGSALLAAREPRTPEALLARIGRWLEGDPRTPSDPLRLRILAGVQARLGRRDALATTLGRLAKIDPDPWVHWSRARLAMSRGDWAAAEEELSRLAATDDALGFLSRLRLVRVYAATGRRDAAVRLARTLAEEDGGSARVTAVVTRTLLDAAWEAWDSGRSASARSLFEEVRRIEPDNREADLALRLVLVTPEERIRNQRSLMEHLADSGGAEELLAEGSKLLASGDARAASALLERAVQQAPDSAIGWYNLGMASQRLERWEQAATAFRRALELEPGNAVARLGLGTALARLERCSEAVEVLEPLRSAHPELYQAEYYLWSCYTRLGRTDEAREALKRYNAGRGSTP